jgi:hypothetical protein
VFSKHSLSGAAAKGLNLEILRRYAPQNDIPQDYLDCTQDRTRMHRLNRMFVAILLLLLAFGPGASGAARHAPLAPDAPAVDSIVYLPIVLNQKATLRVNAPYFNVSDIGASKFAETAIFWFGRVTPAENYADVRIGYNNTELYVHVAIFDRRLWYDPTPSPVDMTAWDAVTLYLNRTGDSGGAPSASAYRFDAQLNDWEDPRTSWQTAYQGNGSSWVSASVPFNTESGIRWEDANVGGINNNQNNRGWFMSYHIPFAGLGLSSPPSTGSLWGLGVVVHDRDVGSGAPNADKSWPTMLDPNRPSSWGQLHFGLPTYTPPAATPGGTVTVRHNLNGAVVPDGAVGGYTSCGDGLDYWTQWGDANYAGGTDFNIQNQSDIADWPCFSKYYVTFPLSGVPPGKVILSATLMLHQFGNAGSAGQAQSSLIQVFTIGADWNEATLTWNNAPLAVENVGRAWAAPLATFPGWPGAPRAWDLTRAVAQAHADGKPLRLAMYEADFDYHSGKYFVSSDTGDWNAEGRPTLQIVWGNP